MPNAVIAPSPLSGFGTSSGPILPYKASVLFVRFPKLSIKALIGNFLPPF